MQRQRQTTEYQASRQRQPLVFFKPALIDEQDAVDHDGAGDQNGRCAENTTHTKAEAGDLDRCRLDFVRDEEQQ